MYFKPKIPPSVESGFFRRKLRLFLKLALCTELRRERNSFLPHLSKPCIPSPPRVSKKNYAQITNYLTYITHNGIYSYFFQDIKNTFIST